MAPPLTALLAQSSRAGPRAHTANFLEHHAFKWNLEVPWALLAHATWLNA
jgi:hypothetical protein